MEGLFVVWGEVGFGLWLCGWLVVVVAVLSCLSIVQVVGRFCWLEDLIKGRVCWAREKRLSALPSPMILTVLNTRCPRLDEGHLGTFWR
jgi:hypothetical protein